MPPSPSNSNLSRKGQARSRFGCRNCKLRKVKCDETRPECVRCCKYRVICTYVAGPVAHLDTGRELISEASTILAMGIAPIQTSLTILNDQYTSQTRGLSDQPAVSWRFDDIALQTLDLFQNVTVLTMGTPNIAKIYQSNIVKLAAMHPFLMHAVMTITAMHKRYLHSENPFLSVEELYHWQRTTSLFNQKISSQPNLGEADAIFATATILNGISFASILTTDPHHSWPLQDDPKNLQWLRIQQGIKLMIVFAQPWRPASAFASLANEADDNMYTFTDTRSGRVGILEPFADLCSISESSTAMNNPYHASIRMLSPLFAIRCSAENIMRHLNFIAYMQVEFISLLQEKDHVALLILAYWYALVCRCDQWWIARRARVECTAICIYLERYADTKILELLQYPVQACGHRPSGDWHVDPLSLLYEPACKTM